MKRVRPKIIIDSTYDVPLPDYLVERIGRQGRGRYGTTGDTKHVEAVVALMIEHGWKAFRAANVYVLGNEQSVLGSCFKQKVRRINKKALDKYRTL